MAAIRIEKYSKRYSYKTKKCHWKTGVSTFCEERLRLMRTSTINFIQNTCSILHKNRQSTIMVVYDHIMDGSQ